MNCVGVCKHLYRQPEWKPFVSIAFVIERVIERPDGALLAFSLFRGQSNITLTRRGSYWVGTSHSAYVATSTKSDGVKIDFFILTSDIGGTFRLHFWNLHKIWIKESINLNSVRFGQRCNIGWVLEVPPLGDVIFV